MGTTAYGRKGSKRRAVNGDRPVCVASCRCEQHTMALMPKPPALVGGKGNSKWRSANLCR